MVLASAKTFLKKYSLLIQIFFTVVLLTWLFYDFDWKHFSDLLGNLPIWFYPLSFSLFMLAQVIFSARWAYILNSIGVPCTMPKVFQQHLISIYFNNFMVSMIGGDWAKVYYLGRETNYNKVAASVFADRFLGFFSMAALASLLSWFINVTSPEINLIRVLLAGFFVTFLVSFLLMIFTPIEKGIGWFFQRLPRFATWEGTFNRLLENIRLAGRDLGVFIVVILTTLVYYGLVAIIYLAFAHYGVDRNIPFLPVFLGLISIGILSNIPLTVNGIGLREKLHLIFFGSLGLSKEVLVSMSLLLFSYMLLASVMGYVMWLRIQLARTGQEAEPNLVQESQ